ncbi:MAG: hypothetical protein A3F68_12945 [Acidobacteria bacterium RIFCSPLOWO2_12_FULL_54_10]|nr:MAG: hypothetical protein A3F68_12945 [Acidobacteria bacterium RIFCSPLOWO2_12_FULL_54_10]
MVEATEQLSPLASELRQGLQNKEFHLNYQPVFHLGTEKLAGFEALLRWMHPERGCLHPAQFLSIAERNGLIVPLMQLALREMTRQVSQWHADLSVPPEFLVTMNLPFKYLKQCDLDRDLDDLVLDNNLIPQLIRFELSETDIPGNEEFLSNVIDRLNRRGIQTLIDDFGAGEDPRGSISRLKFSALKIDRSVIRNLDSHYAKRCVGAIISLAHGNGMDVYAKGIENKVQLNLLREMGCTIGQGFYFSSAQEKDSASLFLSENLQEDSGSGVQTSRLLPFDLFSGLNYEELNEVAVQCKEIIVQPDALVIRQGQVGNRIYFLEEGSVSVYKGDAESAVMLGIFEGPTVFGEMAIIDPERIRTANVQSVTALKALSISIDTFKPLLRRMPTLAGNLKYLVNSRSR